MKIERAREIAAQAWCTPETQDIEMDVRIAEAFAKILVSRTSELEKDSLKLGCLEGAGVDNWCGDDDAMEIYREEMAALETTK